MRIKSHKLYSFFVVLSLLCISGAEAQEPIPKLKVVTEMANVRLKPDIGSMIVHQVPQGKIIETAGKQGEWFLIKIETEEGQEVSGYVHESTVIVVEGSPPEIIPEPEKKEEITEPEKITEEEKAEEVKEEAKEVVKEEEPQIPEVPKPAPEREPSKPRASLWLLGGGKYAVGGDLNSGAQGFVDYARDFNSIAGEFPVDKLHLSYIVGGELSFPIGSNFYLGIGVDYFEGSKENLIVLQASPLVEVRTRPKLEAIPIRLTLSYYPVSSFYLKTGVEYYFAKCEYYYRYQEDTYWKEWHGRSKVQGSGVLGAVGIDLRVASWLGFVVEVTGRTAKISGFKGSDTSIDSDGLEYVEQGTLYHYITHATGGEDIPLLYIKLRKPSEDVLISDPRRAIIDYSGLSLKVGFKLRF
ncbi:MAG: SH3 domain-containing protein [Candidatus Aminicenantes bacterium]|jgi:hypothetical protein